MVIVLKPTVMVIAIRCEVSSNDPAIATIKKNIPLPPDTRGRDVDVEKQERYRKLLIEHAKDTLQVTGDALGITRERVRQLYELFNIERRQYASRVWKQFPMHRINGRLWFDRDEILPICEKMGIKFRAVAHVLNKHGGHVMTRNVKLGIDGLRWCSLCNRAVPIKDYSKFENRCLRCNCMLVVFYARKRRWSDPNYRMRGSRYDNDPVFVEMMKTLPPLSSDTRVSVGN
jgi:hypothetical protein